MSKVAAVPSARCDLWLDDSHGVETLRRRRALRLGGIRRLTQDGFAYAPTPVS